jgi:predicted ATPase/class 3 adenylate cyclase/DNA-binding CsgD family transcriptional regulator
MLASMSEIDPRADMPLMDWSELDVSGLLPTGTVTLLLADVEGSTRLWETQPDEMTTATARLNQTVSTIIAAHGGVRPVEQGEGDSFVAAFARASDAVAAALDMQRAPLAPIRLRIGIHTGEIQLRDEGNYTGPTINRTARLRDLGHGGQTLLSGSTEAMVLDRLPDDAWLTDLGTHALRDLPRPERVLQLGHPDVVNEFAPLRTSKAVVCQSLPVPLTRFVGRDTELTQVRDLLSDNRLLTLTGAGGAGKTRLAIEVATRLANEFDDGVWYVDLAPITDPELVLITAARTFGLPDQPGRSTMDTLTRFVADRQMLVVLDNCEHLLDASAAIVDALLAASAGLTLLATSREPIGVAGEVSWRVPSLSLTGEAVELFADRAHRARPDFVLTDENAATVGEICTRLDGLPLAIELAAARVRALSLSEILDSLHDRFRLLTGGARTAVRRQQTLRASVDWSHALLTEPERVLFRRLAAFLGGFDFDAAQSVASDGEIERFQVLDQLTLLVDKSLVVAENAGGTMRYRLLETVRQYALEKLGESGEADRVRSRHRDYYTAIAAAFDAQPGAGYQQRIEQAETEIDNLRAAFSWSLENSEIQLALTLASSLQPLWHPRRIREGLTWFDTAMADVDATDSAVTPSVRARALADQAFLGILAGAASLDQAQRALAIAREVDDPALLVRALTVCGYIVSFFDAGAAQDYLSEGIGLARDLGDPWRLTQVLATQAFAGGTAGNPRSSHPAAEEGLQIADAIADPFGARRCRMYLGRALLYEGELAAAAAQFTEVADEAEAAHDDFFRADGLALRGWVRAHQGHTEAALADANTALASAAELGGLVAGLSYWALGNAALAADDAMTARFASDAAWQIVSALPQAAALGRVHCAEAALAGGDLIAARRWVDDAASTMMGGWLAAALSARARVALAEGAPDQAERDAYDALARAAEVDAYLFIPDTLECLATLVGAADGHREATRLFGGAHAMRQRMGMVRFKAWDAGHVAAVAALRESMGDKDFDAAWAEGAALSTDDAVAYAQRGRGQRKRPASGWASLTPTELQVVRLVSEGLANNEVAARLFVSPRTVQTHLTHVYTKLGLTSRVQLVQEAALHA